MKDHEIARIDCLLITRVFHYIYVYEIYRVYDIQYWILIVSYRFVIVLVVNSTLLTAPFILITLICEICECRAKSLYREALYLFRIIFDHVSMIFHRDVKRALRLTSGVLCKVSRDYPIFWRFIYAFVIKVFASVALRVLQMNLTGGDIGWWRSNHEVS